MRITLAAPTFFDDIEYRRALAMKICSKLLALCVIHPITAFFVKQQAPVVPTHLQGSWTSGEGVWETKPPSGQFVSQPADPQVKHGESKPPDKQYFWDVSPPVVIQGGALRTCSFPASKRLAVCLTADDRAHGGGVLKANIDLNQGPDNTPFRMQVYSGKGNYRPFKAVIETPGSPSSLFIRNIAPLEWPMSAHVTNVAADDSEVNDLMTFKTGPQIVQGGAVYTFPLKGSVSSVKVRMSTYGNRPLHAMIELVQGPNAPKTTVKLYTEHGSDRPLFGVMDTPGAGNVVRIVNQATLAMPLQVWCEEIDIE
jgi:hypothetical protein